MPANLGGLRVPRGLQARQEGTGSKHYFIAALLPQDLEPEFRASSRGETPGNQNPSGSVGGIPCCDLRRKDVAVTMPKLEPLPQRNRWTHRATAEYLKASRTTVKFYAEQIAPIVRDFYAECPKEDEQRGFITPGFSLSQYQFWVIVKLISYSRLLKADLNGAAYRNDLKKSIAKNQIYLSKASYQYEVEMAEKQPA